MSELISAAPPAGWYADPVGRAPLRWWNGTGWTQETRHPEPPAPVSTESLPSRRQVHGRLEPAAVNPYAIDRPASTSAAAFADISPEPALFAGIDASASPRADPSASVEPFANLIPTPPDVRPAFAAMAPSPRPAPFGPTRHSTVAVWLLVFTPLLSVALFFALLWLSLAMPSQSWVGWLVMAVAVLITVAFAMRDRDRLKSLGHERPASPAWVLLGPLAYLIARLVSTMRNTGKGVAPLVVFIINGIIGGMLVLLISAAASAVLLQYYQ